MKVYFIPDTSTYGKESGAAKKWESFISNLKQEDDAHSITDDPKHADIIIHGSTEQVGWYSAKSQLRPLTDADIRTFVWDTADRPVGRMSGFYCALEKSLFDPDRHRTIHYPIPFNEFIEEFPQDDVAYNFGFVGGLTAGLRKRLFSKLKPTESKDNSIIKIQSANFLTMFDGSYSPEKHDYLEFLRRTRFILCPRGFGVGTVRLFESMQAGRVPVIISDRYTPPSGIDWTACSIRVKEKDIHKIPRVVESLLPYWPQMAKKAREVWQNNFSNEHSFRYLTTNLDELLAALPRISPRLQLEYALGIGIELAAEHLRPALGRMREIIRR